ncbi:unnamed protein product [Triticum turgidum subsp. durum]|uniref:Uncharacterized protein n=1 Tax=Triticum turgidum subsp. durum TaxID=4567 RepID=A0A9R0VYJ0_TRITD|nr:unnamed protein product [Triticum turgidum subsp. durum]
MGSYIFYEDLYRSNLMTTYIIPFVHRACDRSDSFLWRAHVKCNEKSYVKERMGVLQKTEAALARLSALVQWEVLRKMLREINRKMDEKPYDGEVLTRRVEELQRERDELRKDIEQLCMQQAGPGYVSVATRMLSQRTTALEQDIEILQKKLSGCLRENQNLQEELAEAYRVKSQLADLYGAELSKTKELEQQVRFFQSSVAQAFAERDGSLLECEKAKEREEAGLKMCATFEERYCYSFPISHVLNCSLISKGQIGVIRQAGGDSSMWRSGRRHGRKERTREYQTAMEDQKRLNDDLQMELTELKAHTESSLNVIKKLYEVRSRECECPSNITFEEKCSILLDDSADSWSFNLDGETSTSKTLHGDRNYKVTACLMVLKIASLEQENESLKAKISKLQSNLRMSFEIEHHLQRNARTLEKKQALSDDLMRNGLSALQKVYTYQRAEIMKILEEELLLLSTAVNEIQDKLTQICINAEIMGNPVGKMQCCDSSCKDVHVTMDIGPETIPKIDSYINLKNDTNQSYNVFQVEPTRKYGVWANWHVELTGDVPTGYSTTFDDSKALAQTLQEKMEALMLFSQEQERYLLEKQKNQAIIEDLEKNLSQVKDEKVKVLMELAKLKEAYLLKCSSTANDGHGIVDTPKITSGHDQQGMLKTILNRTSLRQWIKKENNTGHESSGGNDQTVCRGCSVDLSRMKVENATLLESVATMERLTSLVHRLHRVLMKVYDDVKSGCSSESSYEALSSLITEANLMRTALGVVLPVSWSGDSSGGITSDSPKSSKSEKVDPLGSASMEMLELLILAADILRESFMLKK